jgi:hypothetical protein
LVLDLGHDDAELQLRLALADILRDHHQLVESAFFLLVPGLASLPSGPSPVLVPGPSWSWDTLGYPPTDATFESSCLHPSWRFHRFCRHVSRRYECTLQCQLVLGPDGDAFPVSSFSAPSPPPPSLSSYDLHLDHFLHFFNPAKAGVCQLLMECFDRHRF